MLRPEISVTHLLALAHFTSQSGPAWHVIRGGFVMVLSRPLLPPSEQPPTPERAHATNVFTRRYRIARHIVRIRRSGPLIPTDRDHSFRSIATSVTVPSGALSDLTVCARRQAGRPEGEISISFLCSLDGFA